MKKLLPVFAASILFSLAGSGIASAANFSLSEPFNQVGPLSNKWVTSGTVDPSVVRENSQTPSTVLQLTSADFDQRGFALYDRSIPVDQGLDISFTAAQWGGSGGADGIVFFIKDADDTDSTPGAGGGGLGYAPDVWTATEGVSGALLGVGLDGYGNFDESRSEGNDCDHAEFVNYAWPDYRNTIVIRGPGQGLTGYCRLADTFRLSQNSLPDLVGTSRADAARQIRVTIDPANQVNPRVKVYYEGTLVFDIAEPAEIATVDGIKMGFSAGTGGETDHHDIWGLTVESLVTTDEELAPTGASDLAGHLLIASGLLVLAFTIRRRALR